MSQSLDPVDQWERKLDSSALSLAEDVTPERLAEAFGTDQIDDVCSEALRVAISDGDSVISFDQFERGARSAGVTTTDDQNGGEFNATDGSPDTETAAMLVDARADEASESDESDSVDVGPDASDSDGSADERSAADASESDATDTEQKSPDDVPSESDGSHGGDDTTPDTTADSEQLHRLQAENQELRDRVNELEHLVDALRRQMKQRTKLLTGDESLSTVEPDEVDDVLTRLSALEDDIATLRQDTQMVRQDGGNGADNPDGRAKLLRQTLLETARTNDGKAKLDRAAADARLGGGLHRDTVLDAMRRAADGYDADINGASDLEPVDSITFRVGSGRDSPSILVMDLSDATGSELRQNLTTKTTGGGG
jgi:hypothetical protein